MVSKEITGGNIRPMDPKGSLEGDVGVWNYTPVLKFAPLGVLTAIGIWAAVSSGCSTKASGGAAEARAAKVEPLVTEKADTETHVVTSSTGRTYEIVYQYELDPPKVFDFSDLPKRKITTPKADKYIPDQSQNPKYLKAIQDRIDYTNGKSVTEDIGEVLLRTKYIQTNDILRSGCMKMIDSDCNFNSFNYKKSCGAEHNYGSNRLSQCELRNLNPIHNQSIAYMSCLINGKEHDPNASWSGQSVKQIAEHRLKFMCLDWRE